MTSNQTKKPHKHCEVIKAYADGETIQYMNIARVWVDAEWNNPDAPNWSEDMIFRVKPQPKPDIDVFGQVDMFGDEVDFMYFGEYECSSDNLKLTFDGETGNLKSAEVISN